jgi:hypothetical protein
MTWLLMKVRRLASRWINREEKFLRRQFHGKSVGVRFDGLRRSERNEAKVFLLAGAPLLLIGPFIGKWSDASLSGRIALALLGVWSVAVLVVGGFLFFRALIRASRGSAE